MALIGLLTLKWGACREAHLEMKQQIYISVSLQEGSGRFQIENLKMITSKMKNNGMCIGFKDHDDKHAMFPIALLMIF